MKQKIELARKVETRKDLIEFSDCELAAYEADLALEVVASFPELRGRSRILNEALKQRRQWVYEEIVHRRAIAKHQAKVKIQQQATESTIAQSHQNRLDRIKMAYSADKEEYIAFKRVVMEKVGMETFRAWMQEAVETMEKK